MNYQSLKSKMINENIKTKNGWMQICAGLKRFFVCCSFGSFLNFDLYFSILIFNFYIYRFWQRIFYISLMPCYLCRIGTCNKGGLV